VPSATRSERPPRLLLRFAVFTALGLALAGTAIVLVVRDQTTTQSLRHANDRARFAADAVGSALRAADLDRPAPARRRQLDRIFREHVLLDGILRISLHDAEGRPTYSTRGVAGRIPPRYLHEALEGAAVSDVARSESESGDRRVLRSYVPVAVGSGRAGGVTRGVAVLEQDYEPIAAAVRRSTWIVAGVLEGLLLVLFLVLAPVLGRVTSRIREHVAELEHVATHDELTGTANRLGLRRAVEERLRARAPAALLVLDMDGFSEVNQAFGADGGDALLRELALRLRWELANGHTIARLGGDEFGALLDVTSTEEIAATGARIRSYLGPPIVVDGVPVAVSMSMGAAVLGTDGGSFDEVLRRAGAALAAAKSEGPGTLRVYEPGHEAADASRIALAAELREALVAGQLLLHYQPQADLLTRQIRGVEALLRWEHPTRGLLTAHEFIRDAERSGVATDLRRFVLEAATAQWHEWSAQGLTLELSVNLTAIDLHDASLPVEIAHLLETHGIPPWNLVLEITERTLGDERRTRAVVERLHALGVRLAIDDFGTEYASLSTLRRLPVHVVKLDRDLLADVPGDATAEAIVGGSIELAHAIGATVVAEGIETREQWRFVHVLGCDVAQGYLVGRPSPPEEISELLEAAPALAPRVAAA
jgi:diguanylate cyclase (GGDEF)-like protein